MSAQMKQKVTGSFFLLCFLLFFAMAYIHVVKEATKVCKESGGSYVMHDGHVSCVKRGVKPFQ